MHLNSGCKKSGGPEAVAAAGRGLTDWRAESRRDRQPCLWGRDRQDMEFSCRIGLLYVSAQCKEKAEEEKGQGENEGKGNDKYNEWLGLRIETGIAMNCDRSCKLAYNSTLLPLPGRIDGVQNRERGREEEREWESKNRTGGGVLPFNIPGCSGLGVLVFLCLRLGLGPGCRGRPHKLDSGEGKKGSNAQDDEHGDNNSAGSRHGVSRW